MKSVVRSAKATPVRVPARPDSLNSRDVDDSDAEFARRFHTGQRWQDFPNELKWIIEIQDKDGRVGIGETYRGASREAVENALWSLLGQDVMTLNWRCLPVDDPRVYDSIESAVLDLAGQTLGVPVYQLLGGVFRTTVECSGWTGRRTPADAARKAEEAMHRGHRVFKFKCASDDSVREWTQAIERRCGDRIRVLLDANQRWNDIQTTVRLMRGVNPETMFALEDPIDRADLAGFRQLRQQLGIPLCVHVALPYSQPAQDLSRAISEQAADAFNINGPMFRFVELAAAASSAGLPCWHGSEVDLGILEASALHASAAAAGCTFPSDIFGELVREDDLIEDPFKFVQGSATVPQGPGLGVRLDRTALDRYRAGDPIAC